jgi:hypothetical protein
MEGDSETKEVKRRPLIITILMLILSAGLMYYYIEDAIFFFSKPEPKILGDADRLSTDRLEHNRYVSISGIPDPRMLKGDSYVYFFFTKTFNYYMFMGNSNILVKEPVESNRSRKEEGLDTGPRVGRLIKFKKYFNQRELAQAREFFAQKLRRNFDENGAVLIVGERPFGDFMTPVIYLILLGVLFYNIRDIIRRFSQPRG